MSDSTLGGFELIEKIGEGGMGAVVKARQVSLDRIVAVKILPPRLVSTQDDIDQFMREARAAAQLKHEGLAQIYEAGEADGVYYFAMEYIDGGDIYERLCEEGCIPEKEALNIALSIALSLDYAWKSSGIIHRDVKPSNILMDNDGKIKLIDLGLVKVPGETSEATVKGDVLGTPNYCSPEQAEGKPLDCRSDIYGLGATLYHMLTGHMPFGDAEGAGAMIQHVTGQLQDPREINPALSAKSAKLLQLMMAKNADDRYTDWQEFIKDVKRVIKGKVPAKQPTPGFVSTVKLSAAVGTKKRKATSNRRKPQAASRNSSPLPIIIMLAIGAVIGIGFLLHSAAESKRQAEFERLNQWASGLLEEVQQHHENSPGGFDKSTSSYRKLAANGNLPQAYRAEASKRASAMTAAKKNAAAKAVSEVERLVKTYIAREDFDKAMKLCKATDSPYADYTSSVRKKLAAQIDSAKKRKDSADKAAADKQALAKRKEEEARIAREAAEQKRKAEEEEIKKNTPAELITLQDAFERALAQKKNTSEEATLKDQYSKRLELLAKKLTTAKKDKQSEVVMKAKTDFDTARQKAEILDATLKRGLMLHYSFDTYVEGKISDDSPAGLHGTAENLSWASTGKKGGAYSFNGTDSLLTGPEWSKLRIENAMSISFWMMISDRNVLRNTFGLMSTPMAEHESTTTQDNPSTFMLIHRGQTTSCAFNGKQFRTEAVTINSAQWHHMVLVLSNNKFLLYVDGELNSSQYPKASSWPPIGNLMIGYAEANVQGITRHYRYRGTLDEIRIYNRAISQEEIKTIREASN